MNKVKCGLCESKVEKRNAIPMREYNKPDSWMCLDCYNKKLAPYVQHAYDKWVRK